MATQAWMTSVATPNRLSDTIDLFLIPGVIMLIVGLLVTASPIVLAGGWL
jgi:hypothetical protein